MVKTLAQEAGLYQCDKIKVENSDYTNYGVMSVTAIYQQLRQNKTDV